MIKISSFILVCLLFLISIKSYSQKSLNTFTDKRNGYTYNIVTIADQTWMAENLNYKPTEGFYWVYENDKENLEKFGYLYDFKTSQNVCPDGWHLPSKSEFETLLENTKGKSKNAYSALKKKGSSGFSALLGGWIGTGGYFYFNGSGGVFWSSSNNVEKSAWYLSIFSGSKEAGIDSGMKDWGFSVRCLKN